MMHLDLEKTASNFMKCQPSAEGIIVGVAAKNCNTTNYKENMSKIRKNEKWIVHFESGASPDKIYFLNQKHEDEIIQVSGPNDIKELYCGDADAMISNEEGICLVIRTADCMPVMLYDPVSKCIGAIHSGWRSTERDIVGKTIERLQSEYGCEPKNLIAYVLPGIGEESYEVSEDVARKFEGHYTLHEGRYHLNLKTAVVSSLREKGLVKKNVFASFYDTFAHNDLFFSHRRGDAGRNLNFILMR